MRTRVTLPLLLAAALCLACFAGAGGSRAAPADASALPEVLGVALLEAQGAARVAVQLSAPTAWRVYALSDPPRLVADLDAAPWPSPPVAPVGGLVRAVRVGLAAPGRGRLVIELSAPARLAEAGMHRRGEGAVLRLVLAPAAGTAPVAGLAEGWPPDAARPPDEATGRDPRPLVMVDPGHGGMDPGATRDGVQEKALALAFSKALAEALEASGRWRAALTRSDDRFLGLAERVARAEAEGAALLLSIHANTVLRGDAAGATVFTLSASASDAAAEALAVQENRADVLAGADLTGDGDDVARALIELSQRTTNVASRRLGDALSEALGAATPMLRGRAHAQAGFRVLKSPAMPSALVELGFLSNAQDLARLRDPGWRAQAAQAVLRGLDAWAEVTRTAERLQAAR